MPRGGSRAILGARAFAAAPRIILPQPRDEQLQLGRIIRATGSSVARYVQGLIALAQAEAADDLRTLIRRLLALLVGGLVVTVGYVLAMAALVSLLAPVLGWAPGFALLAALHGAAGFFIARRSVKRLAETRVLTRTADEVSQTLASLTASAGSNETRQP